MKKLHWTDSEFDRTYFLFKRGSACVHVCEFSWTASVRWSQEFLRICIREWSHPPPHISGGHLWNLKPCEIHSAVADCARFTCLDVSVTTQAVDSWRLADYVLTWLGHGRGTTLIKVSSDTCSSSAINERILAIARGLRLCAMPSVIFSSNRYRQTWETD